MHVCVYVCGWCMVVCMCVVDVVVGDAYYFAGIVYTCTCMCVHNF